MNNLLEVSSLVKSYEDFTLNKVSFQLPPGYIMGLIGPNGSGKTTTIKAILNMITPDGGTIMVFEQDNRKDESTMKNNIGVVLDSNYFVNEWNMSDVEKAFPLFYTKL